MDHLLYICFFLNFQRAYDFREVIPYLCQLFLIVSIYQIGTEKEAILTDQFIAQSRSVTTI